MSASHPHMISLVPREKSKRVFELAADTEILRDAWLDAIRRTIEQLDASTSKQDGHTSEHGVGESLETQPAQAVEGVTKPATESTGATGPSQVVHVREESGSVPDKATPFASARESASSSGHGVVEMSETLSRNNDEEAQADTLDESAESTQTYCKAICLVLAITLIAVGNTAVWTFDQDGDIFHTFSHVWDVVLDWFAHDPETTSFAGIKFGFRIALAVGGLLVTNLVLWFFCCRQPTRPFHKLGEPKRHAGAGVVLFVAVFAVVVLLIGTLTITSFFAQNRE